jgi:hypothetical protein
MVEKRVRFPLPAPKKIMNGVTASGGCLPLAIRSARGVIAKW